MGCRHKSCVSLGWSSCLVIFNTFWPDNLIPQHLFGWAAVAVDGRDRQICLSVLGSSHDLTQQSDSGTVLIYSPPAPDSCSSPLGLVFPVLWATRTFWCLFRLQSSPLHKSYWCFVWLSDPGLAGGCHMPHDRSWLTTPCEAASEIVRGPLISSSSSSSPVNVSVLLQIRYCTHAWFWFQAEKLYLDKLHC